MELEYKKIKDIAVIYSGTTPSTSKAEFWNGEIKWITPAELEDGHNWYVNDTERKITEAAIKGKNLKLLSPGTVLLSSRAPIGKVALVGAQMCTNQGFKNIECDRSVINPEYLYFWLLGKKEYLNSLGRGATFKEISKTVVENILVPIPKLEIQEKIVRVLRSSLNLIEKRKKQILALSSLTESIFLEMFGDAFLNPKGFEMRQIEDVAEIIKGITYKPEEVTNDGMIVLRSSNIQGSQFDTKDLVRVSKKVDEKYWVKANDILMCNRNGSARLVGKVAKIPDSKEQMTFGTFMTIIRSPYFEYLFTFFQTEAFRRQIQMETTVAINQISLPLLKSVKVPLPPSDLQNQFINIVQQVEKSKFTLRKSLEELEINFNALMQKSFNSK